MPTTCRPFKVYVKDEDRAAIVALAHRHNLSVSALFQALAKKQALGPTRDSLTAFRKQPAKSR